MDLPLGKPVEDAAAPAVIRRRELIGRDITIRAPSPSDAAALYHASHGSPAAETVWTYMGYGPFADEAAMGHWIAGVVESTDPLFVAVVSNPTGEPVGMASLLNVDLVHRRMEIGHIWYVSRAQRTTANNESTYLLLTEVFEYYRCRRVEWKCDSLNERSRQAALRLGFNFEGIFRNHMIVRGRNRDTAWFAMTDDEWPSIKQALEQWLYHSPRDGSGWPGTLQVRK